MLTTNTDHGEVVNNCLADKEKRDEDNEVATFFFSSTTKIVFFLRRKTTIALFKSVINNCLVTLAIC